MRFLDIETGSIITEKELKKEFNDLLKAGETDCTTFVQYVRETTGKNGTLERITD